MFRTEHVQFLGPWLGCLATFVVKVFFPNALNSIKLTMYRQYRSMS